MPGNTATDDRRPAFQAMIDAALVKPPTFTVIVVHCFSRERIIEDMRKAGVPEG